MVVSIIEKICINYVIFGALSIGILEYFKTDLIKASALNDTFEKYTRIFTGMAALYLMYQNYRKIDNDIEQSIFYIMSVYLIILIFKYKK